jgi:TolA-binding protein
VASVSDRGAEIALERGTLDLSVVHRADTRWTVRVGPFQVNVIGTRFETSWDPVSERFDVALREGAITVSGPVVGEMRAVRAGERLTVSTATSTLSVSRIETAALLDSAAPVAAVLSDPPPSTVEPDAPATPPSAAVRAVVAPRASASAQPSATPAAPETPGWRALARDARYKDALAAAEHEGFEAICDTAGAGDLRALGDAARLGGSTARSLQAFTALRRRFPGSGEAASAAFILGRIAQDQQKDFGGAAGWFRRYLAEQPSGAFAADASGRLVECTDKMGDRDAARLAAERYLSRYPGGSHAAYAKGVLDRGTDMP